MPVMSRHYRPAAVPRTAAFNREAGMRSASSLRKSLYLTTAIGALSTFSLCNSALAQSTSTPIRHVIVFIGELDFRQYLRNLQAER
jgi:hypothetical protein